MSTLPPEPEHRALLQRRIDAFEHLPIPHLSIAVLHTLTRHLTNGFVFVFDRDLRYLLADGKLTRNNMAHNGIEGRTLGEVLPPAAFASMEPRYRAALDGTPSQLILPFGVELYDIQILPIPGLNGEIVAGLVIALDITDQQQVEGRLRLFEQLVEQTTDGVLVTDMNGSITYVNGAAVHMLGHSAAALIGQTGLNFAHPDELPRIRAEVYPSLARQEPWSGRVWSTRPDGTRWRAQMVALPLMDVNGVHSANATIIRDVTEEEQAEQERLELQQQIIDAQQAALRELSTPLIPLADGVIVMPLVGAIDSMRAQQVMETLLEGIVTHQAETAILDITGVRVVDTQVANALLRVAQAAKLLGAQVVLTGIGPEVAQTIVQLGVGMATMVTRSNLQSGITYALGQDT